MQRWSVPTSSIKSQAEQRMGMAVNLMIVQASRRSTLQPNFLHPLEHVPLAHDL